MTQCSLSFPLPAKPVYNLALRVFQRYYASLSEALRNCPEEVAAVLYSEGLVSRQLKDEVVETPGKSYQKALQLLRAVEGKIVTENSDATLRKFCHVLRRRHGVGSVIARMKFRLGN